jgi:uncharacterized membrane protein YeaQ/YmgE (transglycosylase-associated protein family)
MISLVLFLLFGLIVGAVARFLVPGTEPGGWGTSMTIGVLGALFSGFLGRFLGLYRDGEASGFVMSVLGAIVVTIAYHAILRRRRFA